MQESLNEEYLKELKDVMISGEAVTGLKDCLSFYTKPKLLEISTRYGITNSKLKKEEIANQLVEKIEYAVHNELQEIFEGERAEVIEQLKTISMKKFKTENAEVIATFMRYRLFGFLYFFLDKKCEEFQIVIPDEVRSVFEKIEIVKKPQPAATVRPVARPAKATKIGRNDKCPCGSGKKYKFCCGR